MNTSRFDAFARLFAERRTRRATLRGAGAALGGAALARRWAGGRAQDATPAALPAVTETDPHPSADAAAARAEYLFVQPFAGGTWAPKEGEDGVFTLTLTGAPAQTVYFSDRPVREFGLWPTPAFLERLGFTPANPPNAALQAPDAGGGQDVLIVELLNPAYDEAAGNLTYDARVLGDYGAPELAAAALRQQDFAFPESFGEGGLFIDDFDDCLDWQARCYSIVNGEKQYYENQISYGQCAGSISQDPCVPCNGDWTSAYYGKLCAAANPNHCTFSCTGTNCTWDCFAAHLPYNYRPG